MSKITTAANRPFPKAKHKVKPQNFSYVPHGYPLRWHQFLLKYFQNTMPDSDRDYPAPNAFAKAGLAVRFAIAPTCFGNFSKMDAFRPKQVVALLRNDWSRWSEIRNFRHIV